MSGEVKLQSCTSFNLFREERDGGNLEMWYISLACMRSHCFVQIFYEYLTHYFMSWLRLNASEFKGRMKVVVVALGNHKICNPLMCFYIESSWERSKMFIHTKRFTFFFIVVHITSHIVPKTLLIALTLLLMSYCSRIYRKCVCGTNLVKQFHHVLYVYNWLFWNASQNCHCIIAACLHNLLARSDLWIIHLSLNFFLLPH